MGKRVIAVLVVAAAAAAATNCGAPSPGLPLDSGILPSEPCSEAARTIYRWSGDENAACGPAPVAQRNLLALGDGYLLDWVPTTGRHQLWSVGGDPPLGDGPLMTGVSGFRQGEVLYPLSGRRVLDAQLLHTGWQTYAVNVETRGNTGMPAIEPRVGHGAFSAPFWGYDLIALDDGYLLKWWSGTGEYVVLGDQQAQGTLPQTSFHGTLEALRRGARLTNLGRHRLLEWIPVTGAYRIWSYRFDDGAAEIFDPDPVFPAAVWTDLGRREEVLVVDRTLGAERILVWNRDDGHVVLRALDPLAADPLAGAIIGEQTYPALASPSWDAPTTSRIENVVIVLQQGRSFDSYFGQYCQGAPGGPACDQGPNCCEAMPTAIPGAASISALDVATDGHTPDATTACLTAKIDGGAMDGYAAAAGCGDPRDFACAGTGAAAGPVAAYHRLADGGALGDRYFQTTIDGNGASADLNLIYLSKAAYGTAVSAEGGYDQLTFLTSTAGVRYALYLGDPQSVTQRYGQLPPLFYDPHWTFFRAVGELTRDIALEQLPAVSIVLAPPGLNEQPGQGPAKNGIEFVTGLVDEIAQSPRYRPTTLTLIAHLTSGGYYDHVAPPPPPSTAVDADPTGAPVAYGPRVPLIASGPFVRAGHVSHVQMELSSFVAFIEWNWQKGAVGQLGHRDRTVANIGSLLDPDQTGVPVPEGSSSP